MPDWFLARLGLDPFQFRWLLRHSIKMDLRTARKGPGAVGSPGVLLTVYGFLSIFVAFAVAFARDLYTAAFLSLSYSTLMVTLAVLVDFGTIVIDPDDYLILGHLPIDRRTFLGAKLGNLGVFVLIAGVSLNAAPSLALAIRFGLIRLPIAFLAGVAANLFAVLAVVWLYSLSIRLFPLEKARDFLAYLQAVLNFGLVIGNQWIMQLARGLSGERLARLWYIQILPPAWFASLEMLAWGRLDWHYLIQACLPLLLTFALGRSVLGRFSLDYAKFLQCQRETSRMVEKRPLAELLFGGLQRKPQEQAIFGLVVRYMARDRQLRMSLFPLFGMVAANCLLLVVNPTLRQETQGLFGYFPLFLAAWTMQMAMVSVHAVLCISDDWRASWVYWAAPVPGRAVARAVRSAAVALVLLPMAVFCAVLLSITMPPIEAAVKLLPLALFGLIGAALTNALTCAPPLSAEKKRGGNAALMAVMMLLCPLGTAALIALMAACYRTAVAAAGFFAALLLLLLLAWRIEERAMAARLLRREYQG